MEPHPLGPRDCAPWRSTGQGHAATRSAHGPSLDHRAAPAGLGQYGGGAAKERRTNMNAADHWQAWLHRYGDDYATDEERRAAYRDFKANLATLTDVFSTDTEHDNP